MIRIIHIWILSLCFSTLANAQTINPPNLKCATAQANGQVLLEWSVPDNPCGPFISYAIYVATNINGPYSVLTNINTELQTSYLDVSANALVNTYYYYMLSFYNCPGATQPTSDTLDSNPPVTPEIAVVTLNGSFAQLNWLPSPSPETAGFIIYKVVGGANLPVDTVYGATVNSYTDASSNPNSASEEYTIAAFDSCWNASLINIKPQRTLFMSGVPSACKGIAIINWTNYINWNNGVEQYKIYLSFNGSPFTLYDSTTQIIDTIPYTSDNICVYVTAEELGTNEVSVSNTLCFSPNPQNPLSDVYVHNATVLQPGVNRVFYSANPASQVINLLIERSEDGLVFNSIDAFNPGSVPSVQFYDDEGAFNESRSYYYRVTMKDNCGNEQTSNYAKTILLQGYAFSNLTNELNWDDYIHENGTVLQYEVKRNSATGWQNVLTYAPPENLFSEDVSALVGDSGNICYVVESLTATNRPDGTLDTVISRSNELCLSQLIKIGMPNAFAPDGKNRIFKPVMRFTGDKSYLFEVFDRWGAVLFSTTDFDQGWDGTYNGKPAQQGAYVYYVRVVDNLGQTTERKGTVVLIR